jgi:hypothetical protein
VSLDGVPDQARQPASAVDADTRKRVSDGIRTRDRRDHNPELYQLSYAHQAVAAV